MSDSGWGHCPNVAGILPPSELSSSINGETATPGVRRLKHWAVTSGQHAGIFNSFQDLRMAYTGCPNGVVQGFKSKMKAKVWLENAPQAMRDTEKCYECGDIRHGSLLSPTMYMALLSN